MIKKLFTLFIYWRVFLYLPLVLAHLVIPEKRSVEYALLPYYIKTESLLNSYLLYPFANFDGVYYLLIAATGYSANAGFFPFFPIVLRILTLPFGFENPFTLAQYIVAALLVSVLTFASMILLYRLVSMDFDKKVALQAVIGLFFFPTAFFFAAFYSESLFLFLTLLSFYFARKKHWGYAGLIGLLLAATRIVGIAILPALLWEWYISHRQSKKPLTIHVFLKQLLPLWVTPLGLLLYMAYNSYKWQDALFFVHAQGGFSNNRTVDGVVLLPQTLVRYVKILFSLSSWQYEWWIALLEIAAVLFALTMMVVAFKKKIRFSYILFSFLAFIIPASTGTFTGMPRYILVLFPIFIALALIRNEKLRFVVYTFFFLLQLVLFMLFAMGYFIA